MKYKLMGDSSCDIFANEFKTDKIDFASVPLTINVGEEDFLDDESLDTKLVTDALASYKDAPKTACPSPEAFAEEMKTADNVICVTISSKLSGTYNSARLGAESVMAEFPNKKVFVLDSLATSSTEILLLEEAKRLIEEDKYSFEEITEKLVEYRGSLKLKFILQDLSNLVKTGRMSKVAGIVSNLLSIALVCGDDGQGEIKVFAKVFGKKKAIMTASEYPEEKIATHGKDFPVVITHCHNEEDANILKNLIVKKFNLTNVRVRPMRGLNAFYANEKGLIMTY